MTGYKVVRGILWGVLLLSLWSGFYFLLTFGRKKIAHQRKAILGSVKDAGLQRERNREEQWSNEGFEQQKGPLDRLALLLRYSGLQEKASFMTGEVFLGLEIALLPVGVAIGMLSGIGIFFGLCLGGLGCLTFYMVLRIAANVRYEEVEDGLFGFVNAVSSESHSYDDLVLIFEMSAKYVCGPIKKVLFQFVSEVRNTGKMPLGLYHLENSLENEEFQKIIRNLSLCYRTDADYGKVMEQCRKGLSEHIANREECKAMNANNRMEVVELVSIGILTLVLIGNVIGEANVFLYLMGFFPGRVLLFYLAAVLTWCISDAVLAGRGS